MTSSNDIYNLQGNSVYHVDKHIGMSNIKGARSYFSKFRFLFHLKNHHSKDKYELSCDSKISKSLKKSLKDRTGLLQSM